jgi:hypothetical protein
MGHREQWPDLAKPVKGTVSESAVMLYQRDVPAGDLLGEFDLPHGQIIASTLYLTVAMYRSTEAPASRRRE